MSLQDRVVLVTGAASGVGRAAALLYARAGARVVAADWDADGAARCADDLAHHGVETLAVMVDVSDEASVAAMVKAAIDEFDGVDVVLNNAAVGPSASASFTMANLLETPDEAWDAILAINLKGPALVSKHMIPHMLEAGSGVITHIASVNGMVGVRGADAYTASKGGLIALTRAMAAEWGASGIRTNCLCPGPIDTPMNAPYMNDPARLAYMTARIPLGRVATADEVAAIAVFLAEDAARYLNGAIIPVDGGWTAS